MDDRTVYHDKTAACYTLGCKLNFAETSAISRQLLNVGVPRARRGNRPIFRDQHLHDGAIDKKSRQTMEGSSRESNATW